MREPTSVLSVTKNDLEDPNLNRLNNVIADLYRKISAIQNNGTLNGLTNLDKAKMPVVNGVPDDNDIITWGVAKRMLSPQAQRQAMIKNSWLGIPVRPITGMDVPANTSGIVQSIVDTHAARPGYPASNYDVGSFYYETDRNALYQIQRPGGVNTWIWVWDNMYEPIASQPSDLGTNDEGFLFYCTDALAEYVYRWSGSAWVILDYTSDQFTSLVYSNTAAVASKYNLDKARGTPSAPSNALTNDYIGSIIFRGLRNSAATFTNAAVISALIEATPTGSTISGRLIFQTADTSTGAVASRWEITANGNLLPGADIAYNIGSATFTPLEIHGDEIIAYSAMSLLTGGSSGDVIINDGSDGFAWSPSAGVSNVYLEANASATDTLTTSFADLSGCSLSLNVNGYWLVTGMFLTYKDINDDECQGQLLFDGSAQTGITRSGAATTNSLRAMSTRQWVVNVTSQPKTAKLQAKKNAGTGTSTSDITNTAIKAVYLHA